ncbi:hypothetical protein G6F56_009855 [Rhizopus delemar]|nr:hypothetical protein G6F56_009855 [Rhizopus delemar]
MHEFTCCCYQIDCIQLKRFNSAFSKLESDAILAAEIGQSLLEDQAKYDIFRENSKELDGLRWEKEQSDKTIKALENELKSIKAYCEELINNQRLFSLSFDKELSLQTDDLKQELTLLHKENNTLHSKYKRLLEKHETLKVSYDTSLKKQPFNMPKIEFTALHLLHTVTQHTLREMKATDVRVLNRVYKGMLDMTELSEMSNSRISHILNDLNHFHLSFEPNSPSFSWAQLISSMLKDMCTMMTTLNDLQADYVQGKIKSASSFP